MTLNDFRKENNLKVEDMANKIDCSISLLAKILYGQRALSNNFLKKLKQAYPQIDINKFF